MWKTWVKRVPLGLAFGLPLAFLALALLPLPSPAEAGDSTPSLDCSLCHTKTQEAWDAGAHGQSDNPIFAAEGCETCHGPVSEEHYSTPMPVPRSSEECGICHVETYASWQGTTHGKTGLDCVSCHDPHAANLKEGDSSATCAACHGSRVSTYTHTAHSEQGLLCADCHLTSWEADAGDPDKRDHSFVVDSTTCAKCHVATLHGEANPAALEVSSEEVETMGAVESEVLSSEPGRLNATALGLVAGLLGLVAGMILSPWLERWFPGLRKDGS
jgi:hypothetical protein